MYSSLGSTNRLITFRAGDFPATRELHELPVNGVGSVIAANDQLNRLGVFGCRNQLLPFQIAPA